jgi:hypothetical protein
VQVQQQHQHHVTRCRDNCRLRPMETAAVLHQPLHAVGGSCGAGAGTRTGMMLVIKAATALNQQVDAVMPVSDLMHSRSARPSRQSCSSTSVQCCRHAPKGIGSLHVFCVGVAILIQQDEGVWGHPALHRNILLEVTCISCSLQLAVRAITAALFCRAASNPSPAQQP